MSKYSAWTIDEDSCTYGTIRLSTCRPGDVVKVTTGNSEYVITITEQLQYNDDGSVSGVRVTSTNPKFRSDPNPANNKVSAVIIVPSRPNVCGFRTGSVTSMWLNDAKVSM